MQQDELTSVDRERYRCQMLIEGFGEDAQRKLAGSVIGVVGLGGLGSSACQYLAIAGAGRLIIADKEGLEVDDLGRQVLHWELDVAELRTKVDSAAWKLRRLNSRVQTTKVPEEINASNVDSFFHDAQVLLDCTNDQDSHSMLNRYCVSRRIPLVFASVDRFSGVVTTVVPGVSPCLNCISSELISRDPAPHLIAAAAGVFGALQAIETVKLSTGYGQPLIGRLLRGDASCNAWTMLDVSRNEMCEVCGSLR